MPGQHVTDLASTRKQQQRERFVWHEQVIIDSKLTAGALRFAGLVLHHRDVVRKGYVTISIRRAAKQLQLSERATLRARDQLVTRGWLIRLDAPTATGAHATGRYAINGGPAVVDDTTLTVVDDSIPTVVDDTTGPRAQQVLLSGLTSGSELAASSEKKLGQ